MTYDPRVVSDAELLDVFWRTVAYTDAHVQFCNRGERYTSVAFVSTAEERRLAGASKAAILESGQAVATPIPTAGRVYRAEEHHQSCAAKNPVLFRLYRKMCGRDARLRALLDAAGARALSPGSARATG